MQQDLTRYFKGKTLTSAVLFTSGRLLNSLQLAVLAWVASSEILGEIETIHAITLVAGSFGTLGMANLGVTLLPRYIEQSDYAHAKGVILGFWCALLVTSGVLSSCIAMYLFTATSLSAFSVWCLVPMVVAYSLHRYHRALSRSFGRVDLALAPEFVLWPGITLLMIFVGYFSGIGSFSFYLFGSLLGLVVPVIVQGILVYKAIPAMVAKARPSFDVLRWLKLALCLVVADGAYILIARTDVLMLRWLAGAEQAGVYALASGLAMWVTFPLIISNTIGPKLYSECLAREDTVTLQGLLAYIIRRTFVTSLIVAAVLALGCFFLFPILGAEYMGSYAPMVTLLLGCLVDTGCGSVGWLLQAGEKMKTSASIYSIACLVNVCLNLIFIPRYGVIGAAMATAISVSLRNLTQLYFVKRMLHVDPSIVHGVLPLTRISRS